MKKNLVFIIIIAIIAIIFFRQQSAHVDSSKQVDPMVITKTNPNFFENIAIDQGGFDASVVDMAYNEKEAFLAIGYESGKVDVYDGKNATMHMSIQPGSYRSDMLNFSQDGQYLSVSGDFNATTYVYDLKNQFLSFTVADTRGPELFTSDNHYMILADNSRVKLYDLHKNIEMGSYKTDGVVESLSLSDDQTFLAVGTTDKIQIFSLNKPLKSWFSKENSVDIELKLVSTSEPYEPKDWIRFLWFTDDKLVVLSRFGNLDIFSTPFLKKIQSIPLNLKFINDAVMSADKQHIIAVGTTNDSGLGGEFLAEQIDLNLGSSKKLLKLRTNMANISKWSLSEMGNNELFFVENAGKKMLIRVGETDNIIYKSN